MFSLEYFVKDIINIAYLMLGMYKPEYLLNVFSTKFINACVRIHKYE